MIRARFEVTNAYISIADACHTLTCAIMLLNTDLHGQVGHSIPLLISLSQSLQVIDKTTFLSYLFAHIY